MKILDKMTFGVGLAVLLAGVAYFFTATPPEAHFKKQSERGAAFPDWTETGKFKRVVAPWQDVKIDAETGWNYDLFSAPEITWISSEKQYIAKELPKKVVQEILGLELAAIASPYSRVKVESCSSAFPPKSRKTAEGKRYEVLLKLQTNANVTGTVNFVTVPGVKMTEEEIGEGISKRTICTLAPKKPVPVAGINARLKSLKIAKGDDGSGDGALVTRYMVELLDDDAGGAPLTVVETFYKRSNIVEVVIKDEKSPKKWRILRVDTEDPEKPDYTLFESDPATDEWTSVGKELKFSSETGDHEVKMLDTEAEQITIVTQAKPEDGKKTRKPRVVILGLSK